MKTALLALAVSVAAVSHAQPCIDYGDFLHQSGFHEIHTWNITVHDDCLYLTTLTGLNCYDISDPGSLVFLGSVAITSGANAIAVTEGMAYVLAGAWDIPPNWFTVVDVSDPTTPQVVGTVDLPAAATDVVASGDRMLVACGNAGVAVFDISDPAAPQNLGSIPCIPANGVTISGSWGFVAAADSLHVLDLASVGLPELASSIAVAGGASAIAMAGMTAHVVGDLGLHIVDCSDPWHPAPLGDVAIPGSTKQIVTGTGVAYVAVLDRGLTTVDVSDPWSPQLIGEILSIRSARDVAMTGTTVYLACADQPISYVPGNGIMVIDASNPASPPAIGTLDLGVTAHDLCIVDQLAYVLTDHEHKPMDVLQVIDVSQPDQPQLIRAIDLPDGAVKLVATPPFIIVGYDVGSLAILAVSETSQMRQVSEIELSAELNVVVAAGQYVYAGVGCYISGAIQGVDLTDPEMPEIYFQTSFGSPGALGTDGTHLVVAGLNGEMSPDLMLVTFDISDPPNVQGGGGLYLGDEDPSCLAVVGHRVAMAGFRGEWEWPSWPSLRYVDITDPTFPQLRGAAPLARPAGAVELEDAVTYVGIGDSDCGALQVYSAANLADMRLLGGAATSGSLHALEVSDSLVYGLVWPSTLVILPAQCGDTTAVDDGIAGSASAALSVTIHPNPCNPRVSISFRLTTPAQVEVGVYDVSGAAVATLAGREFRSGEHTLVWNGRDRSGRGVASGVYFVRVEAGGEITTEKLVLVR